jgi:DEAD/DEAH box helicase/Helicase conserved C-terminal domain
VSSFALELSQRITSHELYRTLLERLQTAGVSRTLTNPPSLDRPTEDELAKLLYSAEIFVQTDDEDFHQQAQEIAIQSLLITDDSQSRTRSLRLLVELGNFPSLRFAERTIGPGNVTLLSLINRKVSERANSVQIGREKITLTAYQLRVWKSLSLHDSQVITAPTSAGKSFMILEHISRQVDTNTTFAAVYVTPTRALLAEVQSKLQSRFSGRQDVRVSAIPSLDQDSRPKQLFVLTQERLSVLLSQASASIAFDIVVVDEAQNIADDARGMILQDCLERVSLTSPKAKVILLTPGAEGMSDVAKSFGVGELVSISTKMSPVQQNRIILSKVCRKPFELDLELMTRKDSRKSIGRVQVGHSLSKAATRLAVVAATLGRQDRSLLYETGAREAEKTASHLAKILKQDHGEPEDDSLQVLAQFIRDHVHPEYQLVPLVLQGVAYHYGRMPSLLREAIETSFKQEVGGLKFLVCTTTLAQGVNLPARNVFIDTPTRGRGKLLDPALIWNFAGRAGRLNHDIVGNVFLLNYDKWGTKPFNEFAPYKVKSALAETLLREGKKIEQALMEGKLPDEKPNNPEIPRIRACAGLLVAHVARKDVRSYLGRFMSSIDVDSINRLTIAAETAYRRVDLPDHILAENWTIDPFGLRRLYEYILDKIKEGKVDALIPVRPTEAPKEHYEKMFGTMMELMSGKTSKFGMLAAPLAVWWMKGMPYPKMLSFWVKRRQATEDRKVKKAENEGTNPPRRKTVNGHIYEAFELIENVVRFQFVQLGKAYHDVLVYALHQTQNEHLVPNVYPFALALELGVSTEAGVAFVELGLSRIAAAALEALANSNGPLTSMEARQFLKDLDFEETTLSPVIISELRRLGLIKVARVD